MDKRSAIAAAVIVAGAMGLAGCYETDEVTLHAPGQYKGPKDPLVEGKAPASDETLRKRFQAVQTDR